MTTSPHSSIEDLQFMWCSEEQSEAIDSYVGFRGIFELSTATSVDFTIFGATWFTGWLDGEYFCEGPARFPQSFPEYQTFTSDLPAGRHTVALLVNHIGISTRILKPIAPFLVCAGSVGGHSISLDWKCTRFAGYEPQVRRVNPQLGYIEWCDTRLNPVAWQSCEFDDTSWPQPTAVAREIGPLQPLSISNPQSIEHALTPLAKGSLTEIFGYERDDIPARFFLRDLAPADLPAQGIWRRYDLGRVRLMRPRFELDLPAGTVVEFAYCEALRPDRVSPWITLSAGDSCNLDHYTARGGPQEFFPLAPRGGRFLEVHVLAPEASVKFIREIVLERTYYGQVGGTLHTGDDLLDRIWSVGVETHRACAEDAITDNPTRERGQWAGDVVTVGMAIAASAFADLRLCRRSLVHSAQCAREDGLVAGLCPGGTNYLTTYAAQWINACVHYWELTGDHELLTEMLPYAEGNLAAFAAQITEDGIMEELGWGFVDWGYVRNPGPSDIAINLHYFAALQAMIRWCDEQGLADRVAHFSKVADSTQSLIARYYEGEFIEGSDAWSRIGYHRAALGLRLGFFTPTQSEQGRQFLQAHMLSCFPNNTEAPRLSDPRANNRQLITPYFGHFALPELIEHGGMDFVLDQYRTCWGWALGGGRTTWLEVFDPRWSHCHQWAGCPTWQLSCYLIGLQPRFDLGEMHYDLSLQTGSLPQAEGSLPISGRDEVISVSWTKIEDTLHYALKTLIPLTLHLSAKLGGGIVVVDRNYTVAWPTDECS